MEGLVGLPVMALAGAQAGMAELGDALAHHVGEVRQHGAEHEPGVSIHLGGDSRVGEVVQRASGSSSVL